MTTRTTRRTMRLKDRASVLTFAREPDACPDGAYQCRGGICWPIGIDRQGSVRQGFAVMLGLHLDTRRIYTLAQTTFVTVDHVQDDAGKIEFEGLSNWLTDCWGQWFADSYGWHQTWETARRYLGQVLRSEMIQPKPHLIELDWARDEDAWGAVFEADATGRLAYPAGSPFHSAWLEFAEADPQDRKRFPAVHAMTCALYALQTVTPWKEGER